MNELIVVKVGTSTLVDEVGRLDDSSFYNIAESIKEQKDKGVDIILVTSGAISVGATLLDLDRRQYVNDPDSLSGLAAIGQVPLMDRWSRYLSPYNVAQNLVTQRELEDTQEGPSYINKLVATMKLGAIPVVNENDAVADDEIKYGDNDRLAANIAVRMNRLGLWTVKLAILTDVDGLYDRAPSDPKAELVRRVSNVSEVRPFIMETTNSHGSGFMDTKMDAADIVLPEGVVMHLGNGRARNPVGALVDGTAGTLFAA